MTDKERDDALIAEVAETFPPDTVDVQSRYVIVHQLRASADIQDAQTKRETGWADTSDRACLMRKAADTLDALLHKLQPAPKPDRYMMTSYEVWKTYKNEGPGAAADVLRKHFSEAERPAVVVPSEAKLWAESRLNKRSAVPLNYGGIAAQYILDGAKGDE